MENDGEGMDRDARMKRNREMYHEFAAFVDACRDAFGDVRVVRFDGDR